jgi:hypothetical protein
VAIAWLAAGSSLKFGPVVQAPDRALHSAYWWTVSRTAEGPAGMSVIGVGSSTDELGKIDGKWLIVRREITLQP